MTIAHPARSEAAGERSVVRVFLLDDHEVVRRGLRMLFEAEGDIVVVGEARTVAEATPAILAARPDVAVLDVRLPDGSGIEVCRDVRASCPTTRVLILTSYDDDEAMFASIMAGAAGHMLKQVEGGSLLRGVRAVARGESLIDPAVAALALERVRRDTAIATGLESLTSQERRILGLIAEGLTNRQIGERLFLAEKTIKNHVTGVLSKLRVERRTQAAVIASRLRHG